jgi:hypothetical protein
MPKRPIRDRRPSSTALTAPRPPDELAQLLDSPDLALVVPQLAPETLHRIIQQFGLGACGDLVVATTPQQLASILDLDLWTPVQPGRDEHFDVDRFGEWLDVLVGVGDAVAAETIAAMDPHLVVAGLSQFVRIFDPATFLPTAQSDDEPHQAAVTPSAVFECEIGGHLVQAKRPDAWDAIVAVLGALETGHQDCFQKVMHDCRRLSDSGREIDGLDNLLDEPAQWMYDVAADRDDRRSQQGYSTPAEARAFLEAARRRARTTTGQASVDPSSGPLPSGVIQRARSRLSPIQDLMEYVRDHDQPAYFARSSELAFLANTLAAGCSVQTRSFTPHEASEAAIATCNLGLEGWSGVALPRTFLSDHDLIAAFEAGWTSLHEDVGLFVATRLMAVLRDLKAVDAGIQRDLQALRRELARQCRARTPWRAREALDAIAMLDMPAWVSLAGLLDECPVMPEALTAILENRTTAVSATAFEFVSTNRQVAVVHEFTRQLADILSR